MTVEIIAFSAPHKDGVIDVILPIQQEEFGITITLEDQPDLLDIPGFYQKGNGNFWVALCDGQVVGTISLLDIGHGQGALRKMFVKPAYRGKHYGIAKCLLDQLTDWCRLRNVREVYLGTTSKFLAAHRFYEKHGFDEILKGELPPTFPVMSVDSKFYRLFLDKTMLNDSLVPFRSSRA
jgi:N-acetylglutamate synthase-like GNAT family acetyltransferase